MIDTRDEVMSSAKADLRRRAPSVSSSRTSTRNVSRSRKQLCIERVFSDPDVKPFDQVEWEKRTAEITDDGGKVIFKQDDVEVPKSWSVLATKVVVSKYFYGEQNTPERET